MKKFSYEPERIHDDLYAIPLPLWDGSPVNAYVAIGDGGVWLIDGGLGSEQCQATLCQGLQTLGFDFADVRGLLVTHGHNDHVGAAEAVIANGGQVVAHRLEASEGRQIFFDEGWLEGNGLPANGRVARDAWREFGCPEPTRLVEDGACVRWGNLDLEVVWCPGHTPGLVCLFEPHRRLLFTTDHIMRRAPAPITVRHEGPENPLEDYLASVRKLAPLPVETVLPGHGRPFHGLRHRLTQVEAEIQHQLEQILYQLADGPSSAFDLLKIQSLRDHRALPSRYSVSLVLARLRYLERAGRLKRIETNGVIEYGLA